jgi:hypothetical protein
MNIEILKYAQVEIKIIYLIIINTVTRIVSLQTVFVLVIGFTEHLEIVTTSNSSAITNSPAQHFTTGTKSSQSTVPSPVVAW